MKIFNSLIKNNNTENTQSISTDKKIEEEWIWVEGYKGFYYSNNVLYGYNNYEYTVGETYDIGNDEELKIYGNGFHFCKNLSDVFSFYGLLRQSKNDICYIVNPLYYDTKFCHVKALVKKSDWENKSEKYVSKSIELIKEVSNEELWGSLGGKNPTIYIQLVGDEKISFEDFCKIKKDGYDRFIANYLVEYYSNKKHELISLGYSEIFAELLIKNYKSRIELAIALGNENISNDLRVYTIFNINGVKDG